MTGSGKRAVKRNSRNHLLQQKNKRQKRLDRTLMTHSTDQKSLRVLTPYL